MLPRALLYLCCSIVPLLSVASADTPTGLVKLGTDALIAVSNSGKSLAAWSAVTPRSIRFVSTETGVKGATLPLEPETELLFLNFQQTGGFLSAVTLDGRFLTWAGIKAPEAIKLDGDVSRIGTFELSRSATILAFGGMPDDHGHAGSVWDLRTGKQKHRFEGKSGLLAAISTDEKRVFLVTSNDVRYWDAISGEETSLEGFSDEIESVKRSPDGRYLMCLSKAQVWLVDTVDCGVDYIEGSIGMRVAFTANGDRLVIGHGEATEGKIEVWSLGKRLSDLAFEKEYRGRKADPFGVGNSAIVYHGHTEEDSLLVQDFGGGEPVIAAYNSGLLDDSIGRYDSSATVIQMTPRGTRVALGLADGTFGVWATDATINGFAPKESSRDPRVQVESRGSRCLGIFSLPSPPTEAKFIGNQGSMLIDLIDGSKYLAVGPLAFPPSAVATLRYRGWKSYSRLTLNQVDFSPDGKLLAVALDEGLSIVNVATGKEQEFYPHGCFVARFGSSGNKVFCVGQRQHGIADLRRRTFVPINDLGSATGRFSTPRLVTNFSVDKRGVLVEADTGRVVNYFNADLIDQVMQYGVSENGDYFIMAGRGRGQRKIHFEVYGTRDGKPIASMESQNTGLIGCHVLSDGQTAIVGSGSRTAMYDIRRRRLLRTIPDEKYRDEENKENRERGYVGGTLNMLAVGTDLDSLFTLRGRAVNATSMCVNEAAGRVLLAEYTRASIWDLHTGDLIWLGDFDKGKVASAALSPDGSVVAIGKEHGEVHIQRISK